MAPWYRHARATHGGKLLLSCSFYNRASNTPDTRKMNRSTKLFIVGTALSLPSWFISPSILPSALQIVWVGGILLCACAGAVYWFLEQR